MCSRNKMMQDTLASWISGQKKDGKRIDVWIDGLCEPVNPGGTACIGYIIRDHESIVAGGSYIIGKGVGMTNNVAEYTALIYVLREVKRLRLQKELLVIKSDSQLLVNQMNRKWKVKAALIVPLYKLAKDLATGLNYRMEWIPREENEEADRLTRLAYKSSLK
jgi:ribonuclease HI